MQNIEIDLYTGYEGEPEMIFEITTNTYSKKLRIWDGYFNRIMKYIGLSQDGNWTGLAYYYHLLIGWNEEDHWQVPDLQEALSQLKSVSIPEDEEMHELRNQVLPEIINILSKGIEEKVPVYITIC